MSSNNGIIRIGRKGMKKFAFGEEGEPNSQPFTVDVVVAFQSWLTIDDSFREEDENGDRIVPRERVNEYHAAMVDYVQSLTINPKDPNLQPTVEGLTTAEALDFIARLREQYDELAIFFRPKSLQERDSQGSSEVPSTELRFSVQDIPETQEQIQQEPSSQTSTN